MHLFKLKSKRFKKISKFYNKLKVKNPVLSISEYKILLNGRSIFKNQATVKLYKPKITTEVTRYQKKIF